MRAYVIKRGSLYYGGCWLGVRRYGAIFNAILFKDAKYAEKNVDADNKITLNDGSTKISDKVVPIEIIEKEKGE